MSDAGASTANGFAWSGEGGALRLAGALVFGTASALLSSGERRFAGVPVIAVDLSAVTSADSAGLAVLLTWVQGAREQGRTLTFEGIPPQLLAIARVCGVEAQLSAATGGAISISA